MFVKHPEVRRFFDRVAETLATPELVKKSVSDTRVDLYYRFYQDLFGGKYLVVVVKHLEHVGHSFISTIYVTDKVKEGEMVWPR